MGAELFIARRLIKPKKESLSGPSVRIAIASVSISLTVMISSVCILRGFQQEIREKVSGFAAHIQVHSFVSGVSQSENPPMTYDTGLIMKLRNYPGIRHVQAVAYKTGMIQANQQILGITLKGGGPDLDMQLIKDKLVKGRLPLMGDTALRYEILISQNMADKLLLDTGQDIRMYFLNGGERSPRARKMKIVGIYNTGLEDFDQSFAFTDIRHIQRLNGWTHKEIGMIEIILRNIDELDMISRKVYEDLPSHLNVNNIRQIYPQIFDWLELQDVNVLVILILMIIVSAISMISALFIMIVEKTQLIGILKALGATNLSIRKIFIQTSSFIALKGMVYGNVIGIGLMWLQKHLHLVKLPVESYFMEYVPVSLSLTNILIINITTLILCISSLLIPTYTVTRVSPLRAIRYH
ncbi:MAG TPA: ABC transporter permease [Bacteroidales bacterium]|nr:ABC transporter permease [Bacteroidales bacterium]MDI9574461.1 ABC transporter permease [Bacteroidota bacterium]MBP9511377.1 ABC transporter permease [Bacteroidales bacterium]MBP9587617.1 ABC transporter permease [Bacteroidales bacterium]NMD16516.1 ABC transporter permease [Bacteroidales bacterium]